MNCHGSSRHPFAVWIWLFNCPPICVLEGEFEVCAVAPVSGASAAFHSHSQVTCINGDLSARRVSVLFAQTGVCGRGLSALLSGCSGIHKALSCAAVECPYLTLTEVILYILYIYVLYIRALPSLRVQMPTPALAWSVSWKNLGMCHPLSQNCNVLGMIFREVATPRGSHTAM